VRIFPIILLIVFESFIRKVLSGENLREYFFVKAFSEEKRGETSLF